PAEVLLRPVADPMLLQPLVHPLLALAAPLALEVHPVRRVDHARREELLDLGTDPGIGRGLRVQEDLPDLLSGIPRSPSICWPIRTGGNFQSRAMSRSERPCFHWPISRGT